MKRIQRHSILAAISASVLLVTAACSSSGTPIPTPTAGHGKSSHSASSETTSSGDSNSGSVTISNPLSADKYVHNSCQLLTNEQVSTLGGRPDSADLQDQNADSYCSWKAQHSVKSRIVIYMITNYDRGVSSLVAIQKQNHKYPDFEKVKPIYGYPAFIANTSQDARSNGSCQIAFGVNDKIVVSAGVMFTLRSDPCQSARAVAKAAIQTMKKGS